MKKITCVIAFAMLGLTTAFAQKTFQGTLEYKISLTGEYAEMLAGLIPEKYIFEVLKNDFLMYMQGGMVSEMMGRVLYQDKSGETYIIMDSDKIIYTLGSEQTATVQTTIEETDETREILGYTCKKYQVTTVVDTLTTTQTVWANNTYVLPKVKNPDGLNMNATFYIDGIKGLPMLTEIDVDGMILLMELTHIDFNKPNNENFSLPKDYAVKPYEEGTSTGGEY